MSKRDQILKLPISWIVCPNCESRLIEKNDEYLCEKCNRVFKIKDNIPIFLVHKKKKYQLVNSLWSHHEAWKDFSYKSPQIKEFVFLLDKFKYLFKGRILEIGAASYALGSILKKLNTSTKVVVSDVSFNALKLNIKTAKFVGKLADYYVVCDSERLPFRNDLFDVVFGSSILHHFSDLNKVLREINRVLKSGGYYVGISEPACSELFIPIYKKTSFFKKYQRLGINVNLFDSMKYKRGFLSAGFSDVKIFHSKNVEFHTYTLATILYYQLKFFVPNFLVDRILYTGINILARK